MTFLLLSIALAAATVFVVRPAFATDLRVPIVFGDGRAVMTVFPAFLFVTVLIGLDFALAAMLALMIKELGQVIGFRLAGHDDARFRLIPAPGGPGISERAPASDIAALFVLLMGPGLGLAPMVAAIALGEAVADTAPALAQTARAYALAAGAVNFVALLPLWPLPGGRLFRLIVEARFPKFGSFSAAVLSAFVIGLSLTLHSFLLLLLGGLGALTLIRHKGAQSGRIRLSKTELRLGFAAYFTTLASYFMAGAWVIQLIPMGY